MTTDTVEHRSGSLAHLGREAFRVPEAGALLGLSRNSSYAAAKAGTLPTLRFGRALRVPRAALEALLESASNAG